MNIVSRYCSFLFIGLCLSCTSHEKDSSTSIINGPKGQRLDSILTPYVEKLRVLTDNQAGMAIGITQGNQIIYAKTFGYANLQDSIPAETSTLFHIASVSKPFTAVAITKLVEQGKLNLNDPIIRHIPEYTMQGKGYKNITIQHILTHTSGIPRHVSENDWLNPKPLTANLEFAKDFELDFQPGTKFSYSNSAFDILGIVIERASGMAFSDYVRESILRPAGMLHSTYKKPPTLPENWAIPYSFGLETQEWTPYPHADNFAPSSGLQTTILDMCRWGILHMNKGMLDDKIVVSEPSFNLISQPYFKTPWGDQIGLSWFLQSYLDRPIIMHNGSDTGFESIMYVYPKSDISIVIMVNRDFARTGRIINAASEIIFNKNPKNYTVSAKYKFAQTYRTSGIENAKKEWGQLQKDTSDIYYTDLDDILTTGAVLENNHKWKETQEILEFYNELNPRSTYSWRLLGNAYLGMKDTIKAIQCYQKTQEINPKYEKGKIALDQILSDGTEKQVDFS